MSYITEQFTGTGLQDTFTLANSFQPGTVLIDYGGFIFYEFIEYPSLNQIVLDFPLPLGDIINVSYLTEGQPYSLNATFYTTPAQISSCTTNPAIIALTNGELQSLVQQTQSAIDSYISDYVKYYSNEGGGPLVGQSLTFPRIQDSDCSINDQLLPYAGIPKEITQAACYVAENIFLQNGGKTYTSDTTSKGDIKSERLGDYSYTKFDSTSQSDKQRAYNAIFGTRAKLILDKYRNNSSRTGKILIDGVSTNQLLNSRQRHKLQNKRYY